MCLRNTVESELRWKSNNKDKTATTQLQKRPESKFLLSGERNLKLARPQVRNGALWYIHNLDSLSSSAFSKIRGVQIKTGFVFLWCIDFGKAPSPPGFILLPPEPCFLQPNCILVNFPNPKQWKTRGLPLRESGQIGSVCSAPTESN